MHEQVMALGTLWRLDQARDALIAEARALAAKVNGAKAAIAESEAHIARLEGAIAALRKTEKEHARRAETYVRRRDSAQRAIDGGLTTEIEAAQKQVADCDAIVDQEEEVMLELMESQEALATQRDNATTGLGLRHAQLETARQRESDRRPGLEAELDALTVQRDEARVTVRREVLSIYDQRRDKGLRILAPLENKGCGGCKVKLPGTRYSDIKRNVDIFLCGNCGCYLSPGSGDEDDAG